MTNRTFFQADEGKCVFCVYKFILRTDSHFLLTLVERQAIYHFEAAGVADVSLNLPLAYWAKVKTI